MHEILWILVTRSASEGASLQKRTFSDSTLCTLIPAHIKGKLTCFYITRNLFVLTLLEKGGSLRTKVIPIYTFTFNTILFCICFYHYANSHAIMTFYKSMFLSASAITVAFCKISIRSAVCQGWIFVFSICIFSGTGPS